MEPLKEWVAERILLGRLEDGRRDIEGLLVAPPEHEALGSPGLGLVDERLRAERLEGGEPLGEQVQRLVEATRAGSDPGEVRGRERDADEVLRGPPDSPRLEEERLGLLELALVGDDLALVVLRARDVDDVARTLAQLAAPPVELRGLVPAARVVGLDSEVVDEVGLEDEIAGLLEHGQRQIGVLLIPLAERQAVEVEQVVSVAECGPVARELGMLGGAFAPIDALVEASLPELDSGRRELELHAAGDPVFPCGGIQRLEPTAVPVERLGIASEALTEDSLLAHQTRAHEPVLGQLTREAVGVPGLLVTRRELADIAKCFGDVCHLGRRQLEVLGRDERALEELGRVDVRRPALGQVADRCGVAPSTLVVLRVQEMEREEGRKLRSVCSGPLLERRADPPVDLAPAAEGEALVRDRSEEVVPEAQLVRPLPGHEPPRRRQRSRSPMSSSSSARTSASRSSSKRAPRTEALRRRKRSPGSSVSIRVVISVSTVSGSAAAPPAARVAATSSRTKSGLPPERAETSPSSSSERATSPAAESASRAVSSLQSAEISMSRCPSPGSSTNGRPCGRHGSCLVQQPGGCGVVRSCADDRGGGVHHLRQPRLHRIRGDGPRDRWGCGGELSRACVFASRWLAERHRHRTRRVLWDA